MKIQQKSTVLLMVVLLVGLVLGGILGDLFKQYVPVLAYGKSIGVNPFTVDLSILKFTLGATMQINLAGIIGLLLAILLFKRL